MRCACWRSTPAANNPAPLQQVAPFPYGRGWTDPALQGLKDITSFQVILVVTDSLENARGWIEQVQPGLGPQTQLLLISSAQVAPLVQTYLESGQVQRGGQRPGRRGCLRAAHQPAWAGQLTRGHPSSSAWLR